MSAEAWLLLAWIAVISAWDLAQRRIPNALTFSGVLAGGMVLVITGRGLLGAEPGETLLVTAALGAAGILAFHLGVLGAGDVKLVVSLALLAGPVVLAVAMLVGSLLCASWIVFRAGASLLLPAGLPAPFWGLVGRVPTARVPLAVPYGLGLAIALWSVKP